MKKPTRHLARSLKTASSCFINVPPYALFILLHCDKRNSVTSFIIPAQHTTSKFVIHIMQTLSEFLKYSRKEANLTQKEFAVRAGIALTVIRKIEQGKTNLNLGKVNSVTKMFGHQLAPAPIKDLEKKYTQSN